MSTRIRDIKTKAEWDAEQAALAQQKKDDAAKKFWTQPWSQIAYVSLAECQFDDIGLPERQRDIPRPELFQLCQQFKAEQLEGRGYELLHAGKLEKYLSVQYERGRDLTLATIRRCFERLHNELGALNEFEIDASKVNEPEPISEETEPTLDDVLTRLNTTTTAEGRRIAKQVLDREYFGVGAREVWSQFWDHMVRTFNYTAPETVKRQFFEEFGRRNLSYLSGRAYDTIRVSFVRRKILPETCALPDELLCFQIEDSTASLNDRDTRIEIARKQRQIHGQNFVGV